MNKLNDSFKDTKKAADGVI